MATCEGSDCKNSATFMLLVTEMGEYELEKNFFCDTHTEEFKETHSKWDYMIVTVPLPEANSS